MKSIKVLALIVGAIALLPSVSFADNVIYTTQEAHLDSRIVGNGNVVITETRQSIFKRQKSGYYGNNVGETSQKINASTTVIGDNNIDIKKVVQTTIDRQQNR